MEAQTRLHGPKLVLARAAWGILVAMIVFGYGTVTLPSLAAPVTVCDSPNCTLTVAAAAAWRSAGLALELAKLVTLVFNVAVPLGFVAVAGLIVWRRSDDWMGLLVSFSLIAWGADVLSGVNLALSSLPGWNFASQVLLASATCAFTSLLYLFPNGRLVPRVSVYLLAAFGAVWLAGTGWNTNAILQGTYRGGSNSSPVDVVEILLTLIMLGGGIAAQVWRYNRVSTAIERQQTKWVVLGLCGPILTLLIWLVYFSVLPALVALGAIYFLLIPPLMALASLALPATVGIAVLHYRLFDIDVIIRRTLIYTSLTVLLALAYLGSVVALQQLFRALTGQGSDLAIIISTLGIAALFVPLRNRVQRAIDHRFYRRKYDAAQVLATFAATVRDEVDLGRLTDELQAVVQETMQPAHASVLLLRNGSRSEDRGARTARSPE